jgi:hypothetical protein
MFLTEAAAVAVSEFGTVSGHICSTLSIELKDCALPACYGSVILLTMKAYIADNGGRQELMRSDWVRLQSKAGRPSKPGQLSSP